VTRQEGVENDYPLYKVHVATLVYLAKTWQDRFLGTRLSLPLWGWICFLRDCAPISTISLRGDSFLLVPHLSE